MNQLAPDLGGVIDLTGASAAYPCPATSDVVTGDILLPCNSSQVIQYKWTTGTSTDGRVFVAGFRW